MINLLSKLEMVGIKVDDKYLQKLSEKFKIRLKKIEKDIYKLSTNKNKDTLFLEPSGYIPYFAKIKTFDTGPAQTI